jgi:hypothetical protein
VLQADDIAGISDLYPAPPTLDTGGIVGRITKNGRGVRARTLSPSIPRPAFSSATLRSTPQETSSLPGPRDRMSWRVEPIDDAEPDSFFPAAIDTDFRVTYAPRMVVAPHGGRRHRSRFECSRNEPRDFKRSTD